jgi:hypothetical protein
MAQVNPLELPPPPAAGDPATVVPEGAGVVAEPVGVGVPVGEAVAVGEPPSVTWNVVMATRRLPEALVWVAATAFSPGEMPPGTDTLRANPPSDPTPMPSATTMPAMETWTEEHAGLPQNPRPAILTVVPTAPEAGSTFSEGAAWARGMTGPRDQPNASRTRPAAPTTRALPAMRTSDPFRRVARPSL